MESATDLTQTVLTAINKINKIKRKKKHWKICAVQVAVHLKLGDFTYIPKSQAYLKKWKTQ